MCKYAEECCQADQMDNMCVGSTGCCLASNICMMMVCINSGLIGFKAHFEGRAIVYCSKTAAHGNQNHKAAAEVTTLTAVAPSAAAGVAMHSSTGQYHHD